MRSMAVAAGGALGTLSRWGLEEAFPFTPAGFPWATLGVNLSGAFALGFAGVILIERVAWAGEWRPFWTIGVIGSYTTFSTMALEGVQLAEGGRVGAALVYWLATLVIGQMAGVYGMWLGRVERPARRERS